MKIKLITKMILIITYAIVALGTAENHEVRDDCHVTI